MNAPKRQIQVTKHRFDELSVATYVCIAGDVTHFWQKHQRFVIKTKATALVN